MEALWQAARAELLVDPTVAYLNTGSYAPTPRPVFDRVTELRRELAAQPVDFLWRQLPERLWNARECLAEFVHADPRRLVFTVNVTAAINLVAGSLRLAAPGEILMTNHEYGSMVSAWERAAQHQGLTIRKARLPFGPREPGELVEAVVSEIGPATRVLFLSHVCYTTGTVLPVREICREARRRGVLTVIDGAHAPGMVPVDLMGIECDFYAANLHKWVLAPIGAGFLYVAPGQEDRLQPLLVSWGYYYDRSRADQRDEFGATPRLRSFEFEGTRDPSPWLAVPSARAFHERFGAAAIRRRDHELSDYVRVALRQFSTLQLVTPEHAELRGALTAYELPALDLGALRRGLWEECRIEVPIVEHPEGNFLRVSTHFYNPEEEIDRLAAALRTLLGV